MSSLSLSLSLSLSDTALGRNAFAAETGNCRNVSAVRPRSALWGFPGSHEHCLGGSLGGVTAPDRIGGTEGERERKAAPILCVGEGR